MPDKEKKRVQWTTFITDDDGMTARDWLIVVSTAVYFTALAIGFGSAVLWSGYRLFKLLPEKS